MEQWLPIFWWIIVHYTTLITFERNNISRSISPTVRKFLCHNSQLNKAITQIDSFGSLNLFRSKSCSNAKHRSYFFFNLFHNFWSDFLVIFCFNTLPHIIIYYLMSTNYCKISQYIQKNQLNTNTTFTNFFHYVLKIYLLSISKNQFYFYTLKNE